jgi:MFS family permease
MAKRKGDSRQGERRKERNVTDQTPGGNRGAMRWVVLALMALIIFANYYLYDCFSTLKGTLQTELGATSTQWGLIRNFYNVPNTFLFMALLGGIFLDRFGIRKTGLVFSILCALGGIVTAYGVSDAFRGGGFGYDLMGSFLPAHSPELKMMMLGRLLFGLGAETQIVMLSKVLAKWFMGKELGLAFGLKIGIARVGSALGMSVSPRIAERFSFHSALWVGAVVMISGLILFIVYMTVDRRDERSRGADTDAKQATDDAFHIRDVLSLFANKSYLFIILLCASFYAVVFPFQDYLADLLTHKYGYSSITAGDFTSLIPWGAAVFTIFFGFFIDRKGKRATLMIGGALLLVVSHTLFAFSSITPWLLVPMFGVAFSLVPAAMWPALPLIVEEKRLGTAYGLTYWMQNLWWWAMALIAGWVLDRTNPDVTAETLRAGTAVYDYSATMLIFVALGVVAVVCAFGLKNVDRGPDSHGLELPSAEAAALNEARRNAD